MAQPWAEPEALEPLEPELVAYLERLEAEEERRVSHLKQRHQARFWETGDVEDEEDIWPDEVGYQEAVASKRYRPSKRPTQPFSTFQDLLAFTYGQTPCELIPEECRPREINHVVWDADDTMWDIKPYGIASYVHGPFKKIDANTLETADMPFLYDFREGKVVKRKSIPAKTTINLKPTLVPTIDTLKSKGIGSSIASANNPGAVQRVLSAFDIIDKFTVIKSNWASKSQNVREISEEMGIPTEKMMFVDDNIGNTMSVAMDNGCLSLTMNYDIAKPEDILEFIKEVE